MLTCHGDNPTCLLADGCTGTIQHFQLLPSLPGGFAKGEVLQRYARSQHYIALISVLQIPHACIGELVAHSLSHPEV